MSAPLPLAAAGGSVATVASLPTQLPFPQPTRPAQLLPTLAGESLVVLALQTLSLALLAGLVTASAAFAFRLYTREPLPEGAALILGLGIVGLTLNTRNVLVQFVGTGAGDVSATVAAAEVGTFVVAGLAASVGRLGGDRAATSERVAARAVDGILGGVVRAVGRTSRVDLPAEIDDIDGYEPVSEETKAALQGRTLDLPRGLTQAERVRRLEDRLREATDVASVDVDLDEDGTVTHLGLGRRPAGLGATLPPGTVAVAIRGDPPARASPGDTVQVWRVEDDPVRVGTGELRATAGDVATVVLDEGVATEIDPSTEYRLVTVSSEARPDREFAGILRRAPETMLTVEVGERSPLAGNPLGALATTVVAVRTPDGGRETLPPGDRLLRAGDELVVLGRPAALRELQAAATDPGPGDDRDTDGETPPDGPTADDGNSADESGIDGAGDHSPPGDGATDRRPPEDGPSDGESLGRSAGRHE